MDKWIDTDTYIDIDRHVSMYNHPPLPPPFPSPGSAEMPSYCCDSKPVLHEPRVMEHIHQDQDGDQRSAHFVHSMNSNHNPTFRLSFTN